jgi:hypothetical protein
MTRTPIETTNLDGYGNAPLKWERAVEALEPQRGAADSSWFLGTVDANGKPHVTGIGAIWFEDDFWIVSGPDTRKSRNLVANPACTIAGSFPGIDLCIEGTAQRETDPDVVKRIAAEYREGGWPAEPDANGDAFTAPYSAPSAGPPPWYLYRMTVHTIFGVASAPPDGATRWRFV